MSEMDNTWNITSDIYDIVDAVTQVKKNYIIDQDEDTLALGIFGYVSDIEAKKIQTATIMTGELGNEMFPQRANLTKNVLSHALFNGITDVNAKASTMILNLGIKISDINAYMINNTFYIDSTSPLIVLDKYSNKSYEFHLDYDIEIVRHKVGDGSDYTYTAMYNMSQYNPISDIIEPYLSQPFEIKIENDYYLIFQAKVRQCSIIEIKDRLLNDSVIENKTYSFTFEDQLINFDLIITDNDLGTTTRVKPLLYGQSTEGYDNYCWYLYVTDNTIRIIFDQKSYIPGLNCDINIKVYTTLGKDGDFKITREDDFSDPLYIDLASTRFNYSRITLITIAASDSEFGANRKSKEELQRLIPKAALSRGSLTTETDIENYFNMLNDENNRVVNRKKTDNQISRVRYLYFLMRDMNNNIIPTNTIDIKFNALDPHVYQCDDGRKVLPAGSIIKYNNATGYGAVIDESEVPDIYDDDAYFGDDYYYITIHNIIVNPDPLYAAFYLSIVNEHDFLKFNWVNSDSELQFVALNYRAKRNLLSDQSTYKISFAFGQSIKSDFGMYTKAIYYETDTNGQEFETTMVTNNMKAVLVLKDADGIPYRYKEFSLTNFDESNFVSYWELELETDNSLNDKNYIKIQNMREVYSSVQEDKYGYLPGTVAGYIYILGKFTSGEYGRHDLDNLCPGGIFDGYTVTNVYELNQGIRFYESFSNVLDCRIEADAMKNYTIYGLPLVGVHYLIDEDYVKYFTDALFGKKDYIDYTLTILENTVDIDLKYFNTYGPSKTYYIGDKRRTMINHIDLEFKFRISIKSSSDVGVKQEIINAIKAYIEDIYTLGDLHIPNLITSLTEQFSHRVNYIEFMNYNDFWLGVQHIIEFTSEELKDIYGSDLFIVPEFINIRNHHNEDGVLEPCIDVEVNI